MNKAYLFYLLRRGIIGGRGSSPWVKIVNDFKERVEGDGGTLESTACITSDVKYLVKNPIPVPAPSFTGLLNDYSGAAAAYSLRLLDNTYSGNAVRVRRASDNTEQDIGFANNELDTTSLETFCSGTDGFVTTWYDQSGNAANVTNATAGDQPKIVSSGSTIEDNGKPSVQFVSLDSLSKTGLTDFVSGSFVYNFDSSQNNMIITEEGNTSNHYIFHSSSQVSFDGGVGTDDEARMSLNGASLTSYAENQTGSYSINNQYHLYFNYDASRAMDSSFDTLGILTSGFDFSGKMQEIVVWTDDNSSNVSGIDTNINTHYSIY